MSNTETIQPAGMSQLQRLKALQAENKVKAQTSNMTAFNDLVGVYVGAPAREHFPKLKDENGKAVKDEKGRDLRSDTSDGYTHTLSEFGTSKMIQIVLPKEYNLTLMGAYKVSGLGYDIKGSMFFIEKEGTIANY
ncbi:hypothetical protein ACTJ5V_11730 [Streptococcus suis]|uniref:hypothetical protein n=1 Tax=Streptococcus suis TaxID=1307 RepID=UPI0015C52F45|nr:hypothetical protein [Streptococcus suis]HEL1825118.1 hypothetical protein [Streptococcus suis]